MLTLEEIARLANVSRSTVSRVVNGDPNVREKTRQQVQRVIQEAGFHPNRAARSLAGGRTHVLGLVIPRGVSRFFTDPYFSILIQGVTSACNARDYSVMLWLAEPEHERRTINQVMYNGLIDGVIVTAMMMNDAIVQALVESPLPFILIGRYPETSKISYVDTDNLSGAYQMVAYLLRLGRQRIATITGPQNTYVGIDRLEGYQRALRERGLVMQPELVVDGDFTEDGGYQAASTLLAQKPDAIFAASDTMALGAMRAVRDAGRRIPEDIAVVGFDDLPFAARSDPPLTTVRQPIHRLGAMAVDTLLEQMDHPDAAPRRVVLPTELIVRTSCGAV